MPISPNTALGLLASFTLATWALAWVVHERQSQSLRLHRRRIHASNRLALRRRSRQGSKGRDSRSNDRGANSGRMAASSAQRSALDAPSLESVQAPLPSSGRSTSEAAAAASGGSEGAVSLGTE